MASRGNKKKVSDTVNQKNITPQTAIAEGKQTKLRSQMNFCLFILMLLMFIALSLPITGVSVQVNAADLGLENSGKEETASFSSSINGFSILLAPLKYDTWVSYIIGNMFGSDGKTASNIAATVIDKALSEEQIQQMETLFTTIFYVCIISWVLWLSCVTVLIATRKKKKDSFLPSIISFAAFLIFGLFEMVLLLISFFSGTNLARLTVNISSWLVLLLAIAGLAIAIIARGKNKKILDGSGKK